ncbi:putative E14 prophage tail fiber protein [Xenorhabdus mauleonii]|uniref:E14 prophage tail fiber protein n=1 Tax=Xenorhabdus mauleonii TaxID=351675 RepID=A0A2G0NF40_9GAMM|nr:putative E14 prophage tail fiber protein [Xenorhabdus mauleonii]
MSGDIVLEAGNVGAFSRGSTATVQGEEGVPWNAASGSYIVQRRGDSLLVVHFNVDSGSTPALQLQTQYKNNSIAYRSARDRFGFEEEWTEFYTTKNKPSAADVGAYTKVESDSHFIPLNKNTKTTGYILSKAANLLDDPSSRDLGRSGFLRLNEGLDGLGNMAIHIAHPSVEGAEHARGISFSYGSNGDGDRFRISTYAFDEKGTFKGHRRILTEDDKDSLGSVPVGVPLPWPQTNPPSGYLVCNGQSFNKSTYPKLGLAYPSGKLPDLRGEFIRGLDAGRNIDSGRGVLSWQNDEFKSHKHEFEAIRNETGNSVWGDFFGTGSDYGRKKYSVSNNGGVETRPRNVAFLYIVRAA